MAKNIDLNSLKKQIDVRKKEISGVSASAPQVPKREMFLHGLLQDLKSNNGGNASVQIIKEVANRAAERKGENPEYNTNNFTSNNNLNQHTPSVPIQSRAPQMINEYDVGGTDRDAKLYTDIDRMTSNFKAKSNSGLYDAMDSFYGGQPIANMPQNNSYYPNNNMQNVPNNGMQPLNEAYNQKGVYDLVSQYLTENLGLIIEEAIKNSILEMYAVDRIKSVLHENKELVKGVVYEVLKELKAKSEKR